MRDLFDEYGRKARLYPALLTVPPYLLLSHLALKKLIDPQVTSGLFLAVGDITLTVVLLYLVIQLNRLVAKALFQKDLQLPTVTMLLPNDSTFSPEYKARIQANVRRDFGMSLPSAEDFAAGELSARKRCREISDLIIQKIGPGKLVLQHNTEYGFFRNLLGGAALALVASLLGIGVFATIVPNDAARNVAIVLAVVYLAMLLGRRIVLRRPSQDYARILFREYLGA